MIHLNPDVRLGLVPEMVLALLVAEGAFHDVTAAGVTVTSGTEGVHVPQSAHPRGRALDLRIRDVSEDHRDTLTQTLRDRLGPMYVVTLERLAPAHLLDPSHWAPHLHVEYTGAVYKPLG